MLAICCLGVCADNTIMKTENKILMDFSKPPEDMQIGVTNDGVMGGLSKGKIQTTEQGTLLFDGILSLENNGGFSSLRMRGKEWDLSGWKGIAIRVKGDGRTYGFRSTTDERFRSSFVSFTADFQTVKNKWVTLHVPFSDMRASWRGRKLDRIFDPRKISGLGIILADKKPGPFQLEIKSISVYK